MAAADTTLRFKRRVNTTLHDLLVPTVGGAQPLGFVCECESDYCKATVWLPGDDFASRRDDDRWRVVSDHHARAAA
jgi:hypothetical protein